MPIEKPTADRIAPRLAAIFANAAVGLCELDAQGRFLLVNEALCTLLGRTSDVLRTLSVVDVTHPDDLAPSRRMLAAIADDGQTRSLEKRYRRVDGSVVWARSTVTLLEGADGGPATFLVVTIDLSEQRQAERAREESDRRSNTLIEGIARSTWEADSAGLVVQDSPSWRAQTGQAFEEWIGDGWLDAVHPDDREYARRQWHDALAARRMVNAEFRVRRSTGGYDWMNVRAAPVVDDNGEVRKWVVMDIDISARKSAEAALRASELRLKTLVSGLPQLVWRAVDSGHWTWASPQWQAFTGQTPPRSVGFGWLDAVHPEDREASLGRWVQAQDQGVLEIEHRLRDPHSGRYRWFQSRALPVRRDDGAIVEWLGASTDVDDLRSLHERQALLVAELQHRTRNLLGLVSVISDKTLQGSLDFDDYRARFRDRLGALARVQGLLSRFDEDAVVTLDRLIQEELAAHGIAGDAAHVEVSGPSDIVLRPESLQPLAMAVHELATNAVKYGANGNRGGRLAIHWHLAHASDGVRWLHIRWHESGVDLGAAGGGFSSSGQGRDLIERALPYQLRARTRYTLMPDGVLCEIALPATQVLRDADDAHGERSQ